MSRQGTPSWLALAWLGCAAPGMAGSVEIIPQGIDCVVADQFPRIEALLTPADHVSLARVLFRTKDAEGWYCVRMDREADRFVAVLPRPTKRIKDFRYYIEASDTEFATSQTPEYMPEVADSNVGGVIAQVAAGTYSVVVGNPHEQAVRYLLVMYYPK